MVSRLRILGILRIEIPNSHQLVDIESFSVFFFGNVLIFRGRRKRLVKTKPGQMPVLFQQINHDLFVINDQ